MIRKGWLCLFFALILGGPVLAQQCPATSEDQKSCPGITTPPNSPICWILSSCSGTSKVMSVDPQDPGSQNCSPCQFIVTMTWSANSPCRLCNGGLSWSGGSKTESDGAVSKLFTLTCHEVGEGSTMCVVGTACINDGTSDCTAGFAKRLNCDPCGAGG